MDPIDRAWAEVEANWEDDEAHKRFMALAATLDRLKDAGTRYREVREKDPARADAAGERINELLSRAMVRLMSNAQPSKRPVATRRWITVVGLLLALGLFGLALYGAAQTLG